MVDHKRSRHELRMQFLHNAVVNHLRVLIVQLMNTRAKAEGMPTFFFFPPL